MQSSEKAQMESEHANENDEKNNEEGGATTVERIELTNNGANSEIKSEKLETACSCNGFHVKKVPKIKDILDEPATTSNEEAHKRKLPARTITSPNGTQVNGEAGTKNEKPLKRCKLEECEPETNEAATPQIKKENTIKIESNIELSQSGASCSSSINRQDQKTIVKVEKADASSTSRESCRYGIRCFRRNPMHRMEEAHPGDADYRRPNYPPPPEGTPECPFGDCCYRRNPVHFIKFSHPVDTDFEKNYKIYRSRLRRVQQHCRSERQQNISSSSNTNDESDLEFDMDDPYFDEEDGDSEYFPTDEEYEEESEEFVGDYDDCDRAEE